MRIGKNTDTYPIRPQNDVAANPPITKTIAEIKAACTSAGYNSGLIIPGLFSSTVDRAAIIFLSVNLLNNNIYLYQSDNWGSDPNNTNKAGVYPNNGNLNRYGWCATSDSIIQISGVTHSWNTYTFGGKDYRGFSCDNSRAQFSDAIFFTTLNYDTIYVNDVPVVEYNWRAAEGVSGKNGEFSFSKIAQDYINNAEAVHGATDANIERFVEQTEIKYMLKNAAEGVLITPIYAGESDHLSVEYITNPTPIPLPINQTYVGIYQGDVLIWSTTFLTGAVDKVYLSFLMDDTLEIAVPSLLYVNLNPYSIDYNIDYIASDTDKHKLYLWLNSHSLAPDINDGDPAGDVDPWEDEPIDGLEVPSIDCIDTGFTTLYQVTKGELEELSSFLWSDDFVDNVSKFFSDPREIIVGLTIMPFAPSVSGSRTIIAGGISTGISGAPLTSQYKIFDFGEVYIQKAKGNFLDWGGYTVITAHLPFVGSHTLDVNDVMGKTLSLSYILDFMSGSCVACIKVNGSAHYFFGGTCGIQVPTSSEDFSRLYSSVLSAGASIGGALATVASGGLTAPMAVGAASAVAANTMNMAPTVQFSSGSGSINGMLSNQSAYITVETPNEKIAKNQFDFVGQLSLTSGKVKDYDGFTKCYKAHIDGISATEDEKNEILNYLMNGYRREEGSTLPDITPLTTGNNVILFLKCNSESDVLGKTWDNNTALKIEGKLVFNQSILTPSFIIKGDAIGYNYAYIPLFNRFYHIKDIIVNQQDIETVVFKVDALQSFKAEIDECEIMVERNTNKVTAKMNDTQYFTLQNKDVKTIHFKDPSTRKKVKFDRNNNCYILTIAGSSTSS